MDTTSTQIMVDTQALTTPLNTEISLSAFSTAPLLTGIVPRSSSLAATIQQANGIIAINNGQISSDITTPSGTLKGTVSIAQFTTDLSNSLEQIQGNLTFSGGIVTSDLTTPSGNFQGTVAFAQNAGTIASDIVKQISGNIPFSGGKLDVDVPTIFGEVKGTIEFGNGALVTNLATPTGTYFSTIDFSERAQYAFKFGNFPGVVNFNDGLVIVDLQPQTQGGEIAVPINALSGNVAFNNGQATVNIPTPFGAFAANIDLSTLANQAVTDALGGTGTVTFTNGVGTIAASGSLGSVQTTIDLPQLAQDLGRTLQQTQGTLSINNGIVTSNLITPQGTIAGNVDLTALIG